MLRRYFFWSKLQWNHIKKDLTVFEGCARTPCILQLLWFRTPRTICRTCILHDWEEAEQLQQVSGKEQHSHLQSSHFMHHVGTFQYRKNLQASKQAEVQACYMTHPEILKHTISRERSKRLLWKSYQKLQWKGRQDLWEIWDKMRNQDEKTNRITTHQTTVSYDRDTSHGRDARSSSMSQFLPESFRTRCWRCWSWQLVHTTVSCCRRDSPG